MHNLTTNALASIAYAAHLVDHGNCDSRVGKALSLKLFVPESSSASYTFGQMLSVRTDQGPATDMLRHAREAKRA